MLTKLSSLLVEDGIVSVKQMEEALQRQVIFGGELDTVLLEMGVLDEETLCRYLSLATGLPVADLSTLEEDWADRAPRPIGAETARSFGVVPLRQEEGLLHLFVSAGVERSKLEELSYLLGVTVVPYVVPEPRLHALAVQVYGGEVDRRFRALLERLGPVPALQEAGVAAVDLAAGPEVILDAAPPAPEEVAAEPIQDVRQGSQTLPGLPVAGPQPADGQAGEGEPAAPVEASPQATEESAGATEAEEAWGAVPEEALERHDTVPMAAAPSPEEWERWAAGQPAPSVERDTLVGMVAPTPPGEPGDKAVESTPAEDSAGDEVGEAVGGQPVASGEVSDATGGEAAAVEAEAPDRVPTGSDQGEDASSGVLLAADEPASEPVEPQGPSEPKVVTDIVPDARTVRGEIRVDPEKVKAVDVPWEEPSVEVDFGVLSAEAATDVALEPEDAVAALEQAADRDEILELLVRGAVSRCAYAACLVVYHDRAVGRVAATRRAVDSKAIRSVEVPLNTNSLFRTVVETATQYYGPVPDQGLNFSILTQMDRLAAPNVLVLPVVLKSRVVCLLYCDGGSKSLPASVVGELALLPGAAAGAFRRLILEAKKRKQKPPRAEPEAQEAVRVTDIQVSKTVDRAEPSRWQPAAAQEEEEVRPRPGAAKPEGPAQAVGVQQFSAPTALSEAAVELMIDQMEEGGELGQRAERVLRQGGALVIPALVRRLPGKLLVDRHVPSGRMPPVEEHGPLLRFLVELGREAAPTIMTRLGDPDSEVRFYATYLFSAIRYEEAVPLLYQRLFDEEWSIRWAAVEAIRNCAGQEMLRSVLEHLRGVLQQGVPFHRACAAEGVAAFRDRVAVPMLIDMLDHTAPEVVRAAEKALLVITTHAFGLDKGRWWAWWRDNEPKDRVEWMLDALEGPDLECRFLALQELAELAGDTFGYRYDLSRDEIAAAVARWRQWWHEHRQG